MKVAICKECGREAEFEDWENIDRFDCKECKGRFKLKETHDSESEEDEEGEDLSIRGLIRDDEEDNKIWKETKKEQEQFDPLKKSRFD